jgi:predicted RNase H-like HicB family nuclease
MRESIIIGFKGSSIPEPISSFSPFNSSLPADPIYRILLAAMKERKMIDVKNYSLIVFKGDDNGNHVSNGNTWWAWSKELDTIGDGETPEEAISNCHEGMSLKLNCLLDHGFREPPVNKITMS